MAESLTGRLAAIKEAQTQKKETEGSNKRAKEEQAQQVESDHGKALEDEKIFEAQTEAEQEDILRTELQGVETNFGVVEKEAQDAETASVEAAQLLDDPELDDEVKQELQTIVSEAEAVKAKFAELQSRRDELKQEVGKLGKHSIPSGETFENKGANQPEWWEQEHADEWKRQTSEILVEGINSMDDVNTLRNSMGYTSEKPSLTKENREQLLKIGEGILNKLINDSDSHVDTGLQHLSSIVKVYGNKLPLDGWKVKKIYDRMTHDTPWNSNIKRHSEDVKLKLQEIFEISF